MGLLLVGLAGLDGEAVHYTRGFTAEENVENQEWLRRRNWATKLGILVSCSIGLLLQAHMLIWYNRFPSLFSRSYSETTVAEDKRLIYANMTSGLEIAFNIVVMQAPEVTTIMKQNLPWLAGNIEVLTILSFRFDKREINGEKSDCVGLKMDYYLCVSTCVFQRVIVTARWGFKLIYSSC